LALIVPAARMIEKFRSAGGKERRNGRSFTAAGDFSLER